ncbi:MAG: ATP-binding cassette domain-containing protein [Bacilli bacterium]|nr:ATP-binding cassette domain-containing protein [Bacilli bacterium]
MANNVTYRPELVEEGTILSVENLKQYFGSGSFVTKAVDNVSFKIKEGECFGIVGESGCGKTTTGRSIINLYQITGGSIFYKGTRVSAGTREIEEEIKAAKKAKDTEKVAQLREELRARKYDNAHKDQDLTTEIQMIFQDPVDSLDPRMTVADIIQEGLHIQGMYDKASNSAKVADILEKVGLIPEYASRYPHEFSGGQRQRIGIARALIMNPKLLICDEPISALDVSIRAQVLNLLNEVKEEMGLTMIFIAHDLSVVKYFCDRIAVMYFGRLVELASSDELFAHPMHPYTRALLSAIPKPDPISEKNRVRKVYNPSSAHDYSESKPSFREIAPGHFVLCNDPEEEAYKKEMAEIDAKRGEANE